MSVHLLRDYEAEVPGYVDLTAIPMPLLGGKAWVLDRKGQFVLEKGPGTLRTIACTAAGSGTLLAFDGVPGENGEMPADGWRLIYKANPPVMGSWMLDGGFSKGLTVRHYGGQESTPTIATLVWVPYRAKQK